MPRLPIVAIALLGLATPVAAIEENEPLALQIAFEDCLGFVRDDLEPFTRLDTAPAGPQAIDSLSSMMSRQNVVQVISPRYVGSWGERDGRRYCALNTVWNDAGEQVGEAVLGVDPENFLSSVSKRADALGLTERDFSLQDDVFSPVHTVSWFEPGAPDGAVVVMVAVDPGSDTGLLDAGLIIVSGPPLGR